MKATKISPRIKSSAPMEWGKKIPLGKRLTGQFGQAGKQAVSIPLVF
jgi:hypothetical protein